MLLTKSGYQMNAIPYIKIYVQSFKCITAVTSKLFQPTFTKKNISLEK